MRRILIAATVLALTGPAPFAQDNKKKDDGKVAPDGIIWATSWEDAVKEATARNVPIHFTMHKDG